MKDAKGHGSVKGMRLLKTHVNGPHSAKVYNNPEWGEKVTKFYQNGVYQKNADSHTDDIADAHSTAQYQLQRYADADAKSALASGTPKSDPAPVHSSMQAATRAFSDQTAVMHAQKTNADGTIGRHGYNPDSVNKAIAASNRGGQRISGKQASAIHRLMRGRG